MASLGNLNLKINWLVFVALVGGKSLPPDEILCFTDHDAVSQDASTLAFAKMSQLFSS